ncbi:UDP-glucuronic acid decarboxylase family protein [Aestuariivirga sp.]|uniref:UDP-glucuronic acid decarboxylase family protein n=1 Tax=Aestuariivirga sp. TaxID=2650926 RepID=UPI0039E27D9D
MTTASFPSRRVLIAGGAGFLGSHLTDRLVARGYQVVIADNLSTGRLENIAHHLVAGRVTFIHHDVTDPLTLEVDDIYNLACPASPPHYQADPLQTALTSSLGAMHLLALAKKTGARLFHASTSEIYGDPEVHPQPESYWGNVNPIGPRSCYDEGKRFAETLLMDARRQHGVDVRMVRIFNTYGPRMRPDDGRVITNFITQAMAGDDLTIYGKGEQTRSFCYVDDLIDGFLRLMDLEQGPDTPVNLGNPGEFTVRELAERVIGMVKSGSRIVEHPLPKDDPRRRCPDITLARTLLGWEPKIALAEGLLRTLQALQKTETVVPAFEPERRVA